MCLFWLNNSGYLTTTGSVHVGLIGRFILSLSGIGALLFNPPARRSSEVYVLPLDVSPENRPHSFFHSCLIKMVSRCLCKETDV